MQVHGKITYNGEAFDKFVPQRTASYVDQVRCHLCHSPVTKSGPAHLHPMFQSLTTKAVLETKYAANVGLLINASTLSQTQLACR